MNGSRSLVVVLLSLLVAAVPAPLALGHEAPVEEHPGTVPLKGIVTDAATGKPLAGVNVWAYSVDGSAKDSDTTNEEGRYYLWLAEGKAELGAELGGYDPYRTTLDPRESGGLLDFGMKPLPEPSAVVYGTVLGSDGKPIAGAVVTIQTGYVYYAESGVATRDAPPPPSEPVADGSSGSYGSTEPADAKMIAPYPYEWEVKQVPTDENGFFKASVNPGSKQITFEARGYATTYQTIEVKEGENDVGTFTLEKVPPMNAVLRGRILDRDTGLPIAGASVSVQNLEWSRYNWTQTDENGYYEIRTLPGYARIDVWAQRWAEPMPATDVAIGAPDCLDCKPRVGPVRSYYGWSSTITLESGEQTMDAKLKPKPEPTIVIQGYVVDAKTKKAIPGAWVSVRNEDTNEWGSAQTDADGSYKIRVREGYLVIEASAQDHFAGIEMIEVDGAADVIRVDIVIPPGTPKYAPCEECYPVAYEERSYDTADGTITPASPAPAMGMAGENAPPATKTLSGADRSAADEDGAGGSATYAGEPGGLGPYDASEAPASGEPSPVKSAETSAVPGLGLGAALAALGAVALAFARRARK